VIRHLTLIDDASLYAPVSRKSILQEGDGDVLPLNAVLQLPDLTITYVVREFADLETTIKFMARCVTPVAPA
jgi:hypothetical protein